MAAAAASGLLLSSANGGSTAPPWAAQKGGRRRRCRHFDRSVGAATLEARCFDHSVRHDVDASAPRLPQMTA